MTIRHTTISDLPQVMEIYQYAREQMKKNGNPTQWGDNRPSRDTILADIQQKNSYVMEEQGKVHAIFTFFIGEDPTYRIIQEGQWINDEPYGVIHRLASDGACTGILEECLAYCQAQISQLRMDTHHDNKIMQHLLEKKGFIKCGTIYVDDGTQRIAYQKEV